MHTSSIDSRQGKVEILRRCGCKSKVTIVIGSSWHITCTFHRTILTPISQLLIPTPLSSKTDLQRSITSMSNFTVNVNSIYLCSTSITSFLNRISTIVCTYILKIKHIVQRSIETLNQQISLKMSNIGSPVNRATKAI